MEESTYRITENEDVKYYYKNKLIGDEYSMIKYLINTERMSSSHAHKFVKKIKELKVKK